MRERLPENQRRYYSTRQQLVIITGDDADTWPDALDRLMEAARDVIDYWDIDEIDDDRMSDWIERLRRCLFTLRQWEPPTDAT